MIGTSEEESKLDDEESTQQQPPPSRKRKRSSELEKITSEGLIDMKNKICQHVTKACKLLHSEKRKDRCSRQGSGIALSHNSFLIFHCVLISMTKKMNGALWRCRPCQMYGGFAWLLEGVQSRKKRKKIMIGMKLKGHRYIMRKIFRESRKK